MKIENRGIRKRELAQTNRQKIEAYFKENPHALQADAAEALGLSQRTVWAHRKAMRLESSEAA